MPLLASNRLSISLLLPLPHGPTLRPLFFFENPKLGMPIRQCQAQPRDVGVAGEKLGFDGCDLAPAPFHSRWRSRALQGNFIEGPAVAFQRGLLAGILLVPANDAVGVPRIDFH